MTETQMLSFVSRFAAAWAAKDARAFLALWHEDGSLHYPYTDRVIKGSEIGALNNLVKQNAPELTWQLLGWTGREDVIVIEWECSNMYGDHKAVWRGVDKITLRDGKILEEIVYCDTAPLRELREGRKFPPLMQLQS